MVSIRPRSKAPPCTRSNRCMPASYENRPVARRLGRLTHGKLRATVVLLGAGASARSEGKGTRGYTVQPPTPERRGKVVDIFAALKHSREQAAPPRQRAL